MVMQDGASVCHLKMAHTVPKDLDGHVIAHMQVFNFWRRQTLYLQSKKFYLFRRGSLTTS